MLLSVLALSLAILLWRCRVYGFGFRLVVAISLPGIVFIVLGSHCTVVLVSFSVSEPDDDLLIACYLCAGRYTLHSNFSYTLSLYLESEVFKSENCILVETLND